MGLVDILSSKKSFVFASAITLSACGGGGGGDSSTPQNGNSDSQTPSPPTQLPENSIYSLEGSSCYANFFYGLEPNQVNDPKVIPVPIKKEPLITKSELSYMDSSTNLPEGSYEIQVVCSDTSPKYLRGTVYRNSLDVTKKNGL